MVSSFKSPSLACINTEIYFPQKSKLCFTEKPASSFLNTPYPLPSPAPKENRLPLLVRSLACCLSSNRYLPLYPRIPSHPQYTTNPHLHPVQFGIMLAPGSQLTPSITRTIHPPEPTRTRTSPLIIRCWTS